MSAFTDSETEYLLSRPGLGRLATIGSDGLLHVVPLGWSYNRALDCIDIHGRDLAHTRKFRNVRANRTAALVVDDVLPPWRPRAVMIRGHAEAIDGAESGGGVPFIRLTPVDVISWGTDQRP